MVKKSMNGNVKILLIVAGLILQMGLIIGTIVYKTASMETSHTLNYENLKDKIDQMDGRVSGRLNRVDERIDQINNFMWNYLSNCPGSSSPGKGRTP